MFKFIFVILISSLLVACPFNKKSTSHYQRPSGQGEGCPSIMECGLLAVPKDYKNDNGETVNVFYGVHKALDADNRIGILVFNFGGPSAEAVWGVSVMVEHYLPDEILKRFDIVGIDPRGSGGSAFAKELTVCAVDEFDNGGSCESTFQAVAPYLGSNTVVQDIDRLRQHLGEETLNFFGYSALIK